MASPYSGKDPSPPATNQNTPLQRPKISPTRALFHPSTDSFLSEQSGFSGRMVMPLNEDAARVPLLQGSANNHGDGENYSPDDDRPSRVQNLRIKAEEIWLQSKGMVLVMLSQFFGASMNTMTKTLEEAGSRANGQGMHPFQVLFARMSITVVASYLYMWYAKVPDPLGTRPVLRLLILRAVGGFFGVYCLYYSVQYLALSEATVLTFLAPILSCYACSIFIPNERFTRKQQLAGLVSLVGVVLIAQPFAFLRSRSNRMTGMSSPDDEKQYYHTMATIASLFGVLGASFAYTTIRMIGKRAHPLVSVTYFSSVTTIISLVAMAVLPWVPFQLPTTWLEWSLLVGLGVCGFLLQFLLTAGLAYVPPPSKGETEGSSSKSSGSRATSMLYTQMLFALFYDKVVWGSTLSAVSWAGSALIIASAISVALARDDGSGSSNNRGSTERAGEGSGDENEAAKSTSALDEQQEGGTSA